MKGISRRARACAVAGCDGRRGPRRRRVPRRRSVPEKTGDGVPTGQGSVQLFNYGGYISNGGGTGRLAASRPLHRSLAARPDGSSCATADRRTECRWNRLDALFAFLRSQGPRQRRAVRPRRLPGQQRHRRSVRLEAATARCSTSTTCTPRGWHGSMTEAAWPARVAAAKILGLDYIGTGGGYADTRASAPTTAPAHRRDPQPPRQVLGRGRRRPGLLPQPPGEFDNKLRRQRRLQDGLADPHGAHRPALRASPRSTPSGPPTRTTTPPARRPRR